VVNTTVDADAKLWLGCPDGDPPPQPTTTTPTISDEIKRTTIAITVRRR